MGRYTAWCDRAKIQILRHGELSSRQLLYNIAQEGFSPRRSPSSTASASQTLNRDGRFVSHTPDVGEYQYGNGEVAKGYHYKIKVWSVLQ
jgi:hypothetical protein